jgi:hypothetical protein
MSNVVYLLEGYGELRTNGVALGGLIWDNYWNNEFFFRAWWNLAMVKLGKKHGWLVKWMKGEAMERIKVDTVLKLNI